MEIIEIISFHLNNIEEILEIIFRTNTDTEDFAREDKIPFIDISDFGYDFCENLNGEIDYEDDVDNDLFIDEDEILSFLNEYYTLFIDKLPKAEFI